MEGRVTGKIGPGFLVLAGFSPADNDASLAWMADKILGLRLFGDDEGKMNRELAEAHTAQQERGPVLELGCGTGRISFPLTKAGVELGRLEIQH